jgi:hypothetical protein
MGAGYWILGTGYNRCCACVRVELVPLRTQECRSKSTVHTCTMYIKNVS